MYNTATIEDCGGGGGVLYIPRRVAVVACLRDALEPPMDDILVERRSLAIMGQSSKTQVVRLPAVIILLAIAL